MDKRQPLVSLLVIKEIIKGEKEPTGSINPSILFRTIDYITLLYIFHTIVTFSLKYLAWQSKK